MTALTFARDQLSRLQRRQVMGHKRRQVMGHTARHEKQLLGELARVLGRRERNQDGGARPAQQGLQ